MMMRQGQRGATLVVTLIILVVITIVGLAAVRGGSLSLAIATNSQIRATTFQAAEEGLRLIERSTSQNMTAAMAPTGMIMSAILTAGSPQRYCLSRGSAAGWRAGGCNVATPTDYLTGRQATMVQTAIGVPTGEDGEIITLQPEGDSMGDEGGIKPWQVNMYSTAVMPALGTASAATIQVCLGLPPDGAANTTQCLQDAGATFTTVVADYCVGLNCYGATN